jgi:hypothetical protein
MSRLSSAAAALAHFSREAAEWLLPLDARDVAICTIHGNSPEYGGAFAERYPWPRLQMEQLRRHTAAGFRVFAFGNQLMAEHEAYLKSCPEIEYHSSQSVGTRHFEHVWPLRNWLARTALRTHRVIVHLDSDAFPVDAAWLPRTLSRLSYRCPVTAVQRLENGDHHSDRCFLVYTRAGFRQHAFDFSSVGRKDAGAGISRQLEETGFRWHPMLRSNRHDYHPLIAGLYDDSIYHHGAGTRLPQFRSNVAAQREADLWQRERAVHRVLMRRVFESADAFVSELRGIDAPFDLEGAVRRELERGEGDA